MTKVFTRPRFETAFDRPVEPLELPGDLTSGSAAELSVVDRLVRGVGIVGRFAGAPAMFGVKVRPTGRPVRVTAHFSIDSMSLDWWEERVPEELGPRGATTPRLILVRSQGKTRGAVQLIRQAVDSGTSTGGVVSFELQPGELTAEGLFVLEVMSVDEDLPGWAVAAPRATVGVRIDLIEFTDVKGRQDIGLVSTGNLPAEGDGRKLTVRGNCFVANPVSDPGHRSWVARASVVRPLVPGPADATAPAAEPTEGRPSASRGLKRRVRRVARWVVPVAAAPAAERAAKRAVALERRVLKAAKRRLSARPRPAPLAGPAQQAVTVLRHNPLADVMADLVRRNLVHVELVAIAGGATPGVQVRALPNAEVEIETDGPLSGPVLVRLSIDKDALGEIHGARGKTVRWDLIVGPNS